MEGAHQLWLTKAANSNFSPKTIRNTSTHLNVLYRFIPKDTRMDGITEQMYEQAMKDVRKSGYSDETATNILESADNIRVKSKDDYRVIPKEEFDEIDDYFKTHSSSRSGVNNYPKYRFMFFLLYYTGIRLGECLALRYDDFENFTYFKKGKEPEDKILMDLPTGGDLEREHLIGTRVKITKAYLSDFKITKEPKNFKKRTIPLDPKVVRLYQRLRQINIKDGGSDTDKIFNWRQGACNNMLQKACNKLGLPAYHRHEFRHTFIKQPDKQKCPTSSYQQSIW